MTERESSILGIYTSSLLISSITRLWGLNCLEAELTLSFIGAY